jgi:hypothetical protein
MKYREAECAEFLTIIQPIRAKSFGENGPRIDEVPVPSVLLVGNVRDLVLVVPASAG